MDNECILRKATEILQEDIAAPEDYLCRIRDNTESRTYQSVQREESVFKKVM